MQITLDPARGTYRLEDADVFTAFSVVVPTAASLPLSPGAVPERLGWAGPDGEHVFVRVQTLVELAGDRAADPDWVEGLGAMVEYARRSGWTSPGAAAVRAHCTAAPDVARGPSPRPVS